MWRASTEGDDEGLVRMSLALYEEDPGSRDVAADDVRRTLAALRAEPSRGRAVVLDDAGILVGYALLIACWSNEYGGEICRVDELYVQASHRGRGLGRALIKALMRGSPLWPGAFVALELEVTPSNARARALYERLGFTTKNVLMRWAKPDPAT